MHTDALTASLKILADGNFIACAFSSCCGSFALVAAQWHDTTERVEIDHGPKGLSGAAVTQAVGKRIVPSDILGLQRDQPVDGTDRRVQPTNGRLPRAKQRTA